MSTEAWKLLEQVFTVESLMTPKDGLHKWCRNIDDKKKTLEIARQESYDVVPIEEKGRITGVILSKMDQEYDLDPSWLVSRDTDVPGLLDCFIDSGKPALLVYYRQDVIGLVSPADFNKITVRTYFYNLIGELEFLLARYLRLNDHITSKQILDVMKDYEQKKSQKVGSGEC